MAQGEHLLEPEWPQDRMQVLAFLIAELTKRQLAAKIIINFKPGEVAKLEVTQYF